jgi:hypothetical protein
MVALAHTIHRQAGSGVSGGHSGPASSHALDAYRAVRALRSGVDLLLTPAGSGWPAQLSQAELLQLQLRLDRLLRLAQARLDGSPPLAQLPG